MVTAPAARTVLIVVGGSSGAGKTQLARALGERLLLPVIARDALKEVLLDAIPPADRVESMLLGGASWPLMYSVLDQLVDRVPGVILEANFRAGRSEAELIRFVPRCDVVYLHCVAEWESIVARLHARKDDPTRHAGHFDADAFAQVQSDWANDAYRPMDLGVPVVQVRTDASNADGYDPMLGGLIGMIEHRVR